MMLSAEGLPSRGSIGYEIFDEPDALGQTQFQQNINRLRALEGELRAPSARSMASPQRACTLFCLSGNCSRATPSNPPHRSSSAAPR
jgi:hypothetical protein